jgi:hypothetical protein
MGGIGVFDGNSFSAMCDVDLPSNCGVWGGDIFSIAIFGASIFVGGSFSRAGTSPAGHIARWDGFKWSGLGMLDGDVHALSVLEHILVIAGSFQSVISPSIRSVGKLGPKVLPLQNVATYVNGIWGTLGGRIGGDGVYSLEVVDACVYACGSFSWTDGTIVKSSGLARWCARSLRDRLPAPDWEVLDWGSDVNKTVSCRAIGRL